MGKKFKYVLQGEILRGTYRGVYKFQNNSNGIPVLKNLYVLPMNGPVVIEANNLKEMKQLFQNKYGLEFKTSGNILREGDSQKGIVLDGSSTDIVKYSWHVGLPDVKEWIGYFCVARLS